MLNSGLQVSLSFSFIDGRLPKESQIKMIYGICSYVLQNWIENPTSTFTTELAYDRKLIVDTSIKRSDDVSLNVK